MNANAGWELPVLGRNYSIALELVGMIGFSEDEAKKRSSVIFEMGRKLAYSGSDTSPAVAFKDRTSETDRWRQNGWPFRVFKRGQDSLERIAVMYWGCRGLPECEAVSVEYTDPQGKRSNYALEWRRGFIFPGKFEYSVSKSL